MKLVMEVVGVEKSHVGPVVTLEVSKPASPGYGDHFVIKNVDNLALGDFVAVNIEKVEA